METARTGKLGGNTTTITNKREILDAARRFRVNPHVIEKNYVLG